SSQKMIWHQVRMPKAVRSLRPEVPVELAQIVDKMLAKEPARRYQTPAEVAQTLAPLTETPIALPTAAEMPEPALAQAGWPSSQASAATPPMAPGTDRDQEAAGPITPGTTLVRSFPIRNGSNL